MGNIKSIDIKSKNLQIHISADRLNHNLDMAMTQLGEEILMDCTDLAPKREGVLRNSAYLQVKDRSTHGEVVWDTPYAHYQHEGILYVSEKSGSAYAKLGESKVPSEPEKRLTYSTAGTDVYKRQGIVQLICR